MRSAIRSSISKAVNPSIHRRSVAAWVPLSLFSAGAQGAWYDPSDLDTLFQDAAGTTPVTADTDPVGLMLDKSGNGNHASQATTAARPLYRTDGTRHWLAHDGVDDGLLVPSKASMDWARNNATITPRFTSNYALRTGTATTANALGGLSLSSGSTFRAGDFFRDSGEVVHRVIETNDPMASQYMPNFSASSILLSVDAIPGSGAEWHLNGVPGGFKASTSEGLLTGTMSWGLMRMGNSTAFYTQGDFYGGLFHEGGYSQNVVGYLESKMPALDVFTV